MVGYVGKAITPQSFASNNISFLAGASLNLHKTEGSRVDKLFDLITRGNFSEVSTRYISILLAGLVMSFVGMTITPPPTPVFDILFMVDMSIAAHPQRPQARHRSVHEFDHDAVSLGTTLRD